MFYIDFSVFFFLPDIEILHETFANIESKDHRLQKVKVILLLPRCSGLGVSNSVEFILSEHEGTCSNF
jgi:hypothetical protein